MGSLSIEEAHHLMTSAALTGEVAFDVLAAIGRAGANGQTTLARELIIRVLDQYDEVPSPLVPLLQSLVREHGLFPYLRDADNLALADRLALDAHRPDGALGDGLVFHTAQSAVYEHLMAGRNVILSAPTSFGKSRVVDAYLDAGPITNAAIVVPTIALMDETRRRLARLGGPGGYKVITHASQALAPRNLFVMTQERLLEYGELPPLEFFVIDEFYKLDPTHSDARSNPLNIAFDRLRRPAVGAGGRPAQFYLLGPNISSVEIADDLSLEATFVQSDYNTVITDVERVHAEKGQVAGELVDVCQRLGPGTIVFCRSPRRTREVAGWLLDSALLPLTCTDGSAVDLDNAADWMGDAYHPDWTVARALRAGIGIHHGKLPRAVGHHLVRLFNEERLPILLVTSTLIEGVNTSAKNMVVLDHVIARKKYDYFTFANIRGRSGRMSKHFVGKVVVFNPEPQRADLNVEIPITTQSDKATPEILIQLPDDELTPRSKQRLGPYLNHPSVSADTLRANEGVSLDAQVQVASRLAAEPRRWQRALDWRGLPDTGQVREVSRLLESLVPTSGAVRSMEQLGARINRMRYTRGDLRALVDDQVAERGVTVDDAMDDHLEFVRNYAQFAIPTGLVAAHRLARDVLGDAARIADPAAFAGELENLFQPSYTAVLEEYGMPTPLTRRLSRALDLDRAADLDTVLGRLAALDLDAYELRPFEVEMVHDTQQTL